MFTTEQDKVTKKGGGGQSSPHSYADITDGVEWGLSGNKLVAIVNDRGIVCLRV